MRNKWLCTYFSSHWMCLVPPQVSSPMPLSCLWSSFDCHVFYPCSFLWTWWRELDHLLHPWEIAFQILSLEFDAYTLQLSKLLVRFLKRVSHLWLHMIEQWCQIPHLSHLEWLEQFLSIWLILTYFEFCININILD